MEPQQQQQLHQQQQPNEDGGSSKSSFLCRQSSTRWTPTTDQIRILKDLYYNNGVRSPSADQIQRISARLRQYGKIEGKNVFYWFQNHKARERQKKRFITDIPLQQRGLVNGGWRSDQDPIHNKYPNLSPGAPTPSSSSPGVLAVGQMAGSYGYGSVTMEKSFRDCSISAGGSGHGTGGSIDHHNFGWMGHVDSYSSSYPFFDKRKSIDESLEEEQEDQAPEIETLPLFPMHGEDISSFCNMKPESDNYYSGWYRSNGSSRTSLELSLNSYAGRSSDSQ